MLEKIDILTKALGSIRYGIHNVMMIYSSITVDAIRIWHNWQATLHKIVVNLLNTRKDNLDLENHLDQEEHLELELEQAPKIWYH